MSSSSFILEIKLNTTDHDERVLNERFFHGFLMYNKLVSHAKKCLKGLRQDKQYRALMEQYANAKTKQEQKLLYPELNVLRLEYGLSEYQFHHWISVQQKKNKKFIDSNTAQKIATRVWRAVEEVIFRKGKTIHHKKLMSFMSMEGKSNASGLRYRNGKLFWIGLCIPAPVKKSDYYAQEALTHRVKYCRIVRKPMGITWHFYLQLVLEGIPPKKRTFLPGGDVGIDPGVSVEAIVSKNGCMLTELASNQEKIKKEIRRLQRKMDRSLRAMNPNNYKENGVPKKHQKWLKSKNYKKTQMILKTLRRRNTDAIKQSEEILSNEVLCNYGSDIHTEKMNYKALQSRSKKTKKKKNGKYRSKKRFGTSIAGHAPSRFLSILERKLSYIGKEVHYVNTQEYKASQLDHTTGEYIKPSLKERWKVIDGHNVQRDLYSAFLLMNAYNDELPDIQKCNDFFSEFLLLHDSCIQELKNKGISKVSVFGF